MITISATYRIGSTQVVCLRSADRAVIKARVQDRVLGSVLVALTATPQTVLC